ncbi:MAG TPA: glycosyltransferase [Terrimicrobiaceae bacterium]
MSYRIYDIDVLRTFDELLIREGDSGVALIIRRADVPIGFIMADCQPGSVISREAVCQLINDRIPSDLVIGQQRLETAGCASCAAIPSLTVAICTKDRPVDLANCLRQLLKVRTEYSACDVDVLVIDNAPCSQHTRDIVAELPDVRYFLEPREGLNFARNRALEVSTADIIAFIDDDVTIDRGWFDGLRCALNQHPDAAAFTGLVLPVELKTEAQILFERRGGFQRNFYSMRYGATLPGHHSYPCVGGKFGTGCNMAIRRSVLLRLGGFDEALDTGQALPGGGDTDILYRIIRAGYALVYEPRFLVFHRHRRDMSQLRAQYARSWGLGLMAYIAKTYSYDRPQRANLRRFVKCWFVSEFQQILQSVTGRHPLPVDMILAELLGGIVGLSGAYGRSKKRTRRIRATNQLPSQPESDSTRKAHTYGRPGCPITPQMQL